MRKDTIPETPLYGYVPFEYPEIKEYIPPVDDTLISSRRSDFNRDIARQEFMDLSIFADTLNFVNE